MKTVLDKARLAQLRTVAAEAGMPRAARASETAILKWSVSGVALTLPQRRALGLSETAYLATIPKRTPITIFDPIKEAGDLKLPKSKVRSLAPRQWRRHRVEKFKGLRGAPGREVTVTIKKRHRLRGLSVSATKAQLDAARGAL